MARWAAAASLLAGLLWPANTAGAQAGFTIEQALSAPFCSELRAAPVRAQLAWVANIDGRAQPVDRRTGRQRLRLAPDHALRRRRRPGAERPAIGRPMRARSSTRAATPRRARATRSPTRRGSRWARSSRCGSYNLAGRESTAACSARATSPAVSPDGKTVAYIDKGQVWTVQARRCQRRQAGATAADPRLGAWFALVAGQLAPRIRQRSRRSQLYRGLFFHCQGSRLP